MEPIPLTEDWLLKMGFKKASDNCYIKTYPNNCDFILFDWLTPIAVSNGFKEGDYYYFFHRTAHTIRYVHQLQNLYFSLTGNELTIK